MDHPAASSDQDVDHSMMDHSMMDHSNMGGHMREMLPVEQIDEVTSQVMDHGMMVSSMD